MNYNKSVINFDEKTHTYTNESGVKYQSVSGLIGLYKKPFDVEFFSKMVARKRGISQDVVKQEWKNNTENACAFGKDVHATVEKYVKTGEVDELNIISEFKKVFDYKDGINSEKLLWSHDFKLAGTSDIIVDVSDATFDVLDVKTNKKFDFYSKYNEHLLTPLTHLQNCKYTTYSLQLSLYAYMYSNMTGKKPRQLALLYWNKTCFEKYYAPYMYWDVNVLLRHYSSTSTINN